MNCIKSSIFDIFKIGPGPSSSHTIGPLLAAGDFRERIAVLPQETRDSAHSLGITFYGSLAATGIGHGSHRAVIAGLMGEKPETCNIKLLDSLCTSNNAVHEIIIGTMKLILSEASVKYSRDNSPLRHANTMQLELLSASGEILHKEIYYSVGGGAVEREGEQPQDNIPTPPFRYRNWQTFNELLKKYEISPQEIMIRNEMTVRNCGKDEIFRRLDRVIEVMHNAVANGLATEGVLPGPIGMERKARTIYRHAASAPLAIGDQAAKLDAYALAAAEENAAGHLIVTAPTSGSSGIMAAVVYALIQQNTPREQLYSGLMTAALIGMIVRHNGSISGAEVGCQGEVGVAAAMAAGMLASIRQNEWKRVETAAEIALEHHLGLTCDPVGGYVQIPCIERNAMATITACNACLLASCGNPGTQKVSFDEVVAAMMDTGKAMPVRFRETAMGGLATCALCS